MNNQATYKQGTGWSIVEYYKNHIKSRSDTEKSPRCIQQRYGVKQAKERWRTQCTLSSTLKIKSGFKWRWRWEWGRYNHNSLYTYMKFSNMKMLFLKSVQRERNMYHECTWTWAHTYIAHTHTCTHRGSCRVYRYWRKLDFYLRRTRCLGTREFSMYSFWTWDHWNFCPSLFKKENY